MFEIFHNKSEFEEKIKGTEFGPNNSLEEWYCTEKRRNRGFWRREEF